MEIEAEKGGTIKHPSGSVISIPKNSLVDENGNIVSGKVQFKYREFMNKAALIGSGIPMRLVDTDYNQFLVSSGMMEIYASQNGKAVFIKEGNSLSVDLINTTDKPGYNVYYLDTNNREWIETAHEVNPIVKTVSNTIKGKNNVDMTKLEQEAEKKGYINPVKPEKANTKRHQFQFKINLQAFPELNVYDGVMFEYVGKTKAEDPEENPWVKTQFWHEMELLKTAKKGVYTLVLTAPDKNFRTTVKPVFDKEDMEYAMDVYTDRYNRYRNYVAKQKKEKQDANARKVTTTTISRTFEVRQFGVWNTDRLEILDNTQPLLVKLSHTDTTVKFVGAYLIVGRRNGTLNLEIKNNILQSFKYPKAENAKVLLSDKTGKCYLLDKKQLDELAKQGNETAFVVNKEG
jgi:hypothetical protein